MLGSSWCCSGSPPQLQAVMHKFGTWTSLPAQGDASKVQEGCAMNICLFHAHLAANSPAAALGCCFGKLAEQCKSSKTTQGSGFGVFSLACQQAGMWKREAAHFQGLYEQEGQLLEFKAVSSTVNLFLCYL